MPKITDWLIAIGSLSVVFVAIFLEQIKSLFFKPKLKLHINVKPPDCHKTHLQPFDNPRSRKAECYYFRLRIENTGNRLAENVEVYAYELIKLIGNNNFEKVDKFLPMNLVWSHIGNIQQEGISPEMNRFCDLGCIIKPDERGLFLYEDLFKPLIKPSETIFSFTLQQRSFTKSHLITPGKYVLTLFVAASNVKPKKYYLEIDHKGIWYDEEKIMLQDGIDICINKTEEPTQILNFLHAPRQIAGYNFVTDNFINY